MSQGIYEETFQLRQHRALQGLLPGQRSFETNIVGIHLVVRISKGQTGDGRGSVCTGDAVDFYPQTAKAPLKASFARCNHA
jgi:hypothetical protein